MYIGNILKMRSQLDETVNYSLPIDEQEIAMNPLLGQKLRLKHTGTINCINCHAVTKKSYSQGYCYPCMMKLAACDMCIVKPETCHFAEGTCREPQWGLDNCMKPHYVYLANSSGIKVGITRESQIPTRWIDQGAVQALPIAKVQTRLQSGLLEVIFKNHVNDKTDWRKMLKNQVETVDLQAMRDRLFNECQTEIATLQESLERDDIALLENEAGVDIHYPVIAYPEKVKPINLDKTPEVEGTLQGIKGQYLILDTGVLNVRKYTGYQLEFES